MAIAVCGLALVLTASTQAQGLQERLGQTERELDETKAEEGVLTSEIEQMGDRISALETRVADLRNREAVLAAELAAKEAELDQAQARLAELRDRLREAVRLLEDRLVAIYKSSDPDLLTVVLSADGFDDLLERTEYLQRLEDQDASIIGRVRALRDEMRATVEQVRAARDAIAARKQELEEIRAELEQQSASLSAARQQREATLEQVREQRHELEADLTRISKKVEEQLRESGSAPLPAGPIRGGSSGFIWPVTGTLTSSFGMRWGRMHEGIDIAAPGGTPIRAPKAGTIELAAYTGGYGNYTCIDHGGSLSTCYAHQQGFARTSGTVSQGTVIGYVGTTGNSTGNHLHFEVRINGSATDPMGYL